PFFLFPAPTTTDSHPLSLHDALPIFTALGLGRDSDVFAAGVDLHGVHDRLPAVNPSQLAHALVGDGITEDELKEALHVEFQSSPDRKSTRLNSSHGSISYAVFCFKNK